MTTMLRAYEIPWRRFTVPEC